MAELNFEEARFNMVEQQVRPWEVLNHNILDLMMDVPREAFVPEAYQHLAFADIHVPLAHDQVMMAPKQEGRVLQTLTLKNTDRVLEIGTGSGYLTALLGRLVNHVDSVDIYDTFTKATEAALKAHNITNVDLSTGDAVNGWNKDTQYDAIVLTGSLPVFNAQFQEQLTVGGRLFIIVGEPPIMEARLITRVSEQEWIEDSVFETSIPALVGAPLPRRFVL